MPDLLNVKIHAIFNKQSLKEKCMSSFCLCHVFMTNILSHLRKVAMRGLPTEHHHEMRQK